MTVPDFLLPDLGEGLEEAEVTAWHVRVGDQVAVDQIVAEVETAKAAVEVPIPFAGTVTALHAEPGTTVPVGAPLISVAADAPDAPDPSPRPYRMTAGRTRRRRRSQRQRPGRLWHQAIPAARPRYAQARGLRHQVARSGRCHRRGRASPRPRDLRRSPRADAGRPGAGHLTDRAQARPPGRA